MQIQHHVMPIRRSPDARLKTLGPFSRRLVAEVASARFLLRCDGEMPKPAITLIAEQKKQLARPRFSLNAE